MRRSSQPDREAFAGRPARPARVEAADGRARADGLSAAVLAAGLLRSARACRRLARCWPFTRTVRRRHDLAGRIGWALAPADHGHRLARGILKARLRIAPNARPALAQRQQQQRNRATQNPAAMRPARGNSKPIGSAREIRTGGAGIVRYSRAGKKQQQQGAELASATVAPHSRSRPARCRSKARTNRSRAHRKTRIAGKEQVEGACRSIATRSRSAAWSAINKAAVADARTGRRGPEHSRARLHIIGRVDAVDNQTPQHQRMIGSPGMPRVRGRGRRRRCMEAALCSRLRGPASLSTSALAKRSRHRGGNAPLHRIAQEGRKASTAVAGSAPKETAQRAAGRHRPGQCGGRS